MYIKTGSCPSVAAEPPWPLGPHVAGYKYKVKTNKTTNGCLATSNRTHVVNKLRNLLAQAGTTGHYSGRPSRQGAATWARRAGTPDDDIQPRDRQKSDEYKRYIHH